MVYQRDAGPNCGLPAKRCLEPMCSSDRGTCD